jgi:hypothetical protein
MHAFGVGATVDLPNFSVIIAGLDRWDETYQVRITEERLLAAVQRELGPQVRELRRAPWLEETRNPFDDWSRVGIPVYPFPRWMRCPRCNLLTTVDRGLLRLDKNAFRPDLTRYVHENCGRGRPPTAVPARFVVACTQGHLDDFPWEWFCHLSGPCTGSPILEVFEVGAGSRSTDLRVRCRTCDRGNPLSLAFGESASHSMPACRGRHPHLRSFDSEGCPERVRAMLLGASNAWFAKTLSALALPVGGGGLAQRVADRWSDLERVPSQEVLAFLVQEQPTFRPLGDVPIDELWAAIEQHRAGVPGASEADLMGPEWDLLSNPAATPRSTDFRVSAAEVPPEYGARIAAVGLAERLRAVTALVGFSRIDGPDSGLASDEQGATIAPISAAPPTWVPAAEVRGEGVFLRLNEDAVQAWVERTVVHPRMEALERGHGRWMQRRGLDPHRDWVGARYILVHSLAHAMIAAFALEAGYSSASIQERLYVRGAAEDGGPMAGILLYTAASDSEGTLGGLVNLGAPENLGRMLSVALEHVRMCSSDPICAEHQPGDEEETLHGAACHACLFVSETSCERNNRYLDRAALVPTVADTGLEFFPS